MHFRTLVQAAVAASILVGTPLQAEDESTIEPVVVTATRTAQVADETVAPVDVITRQEIESSGAITLTDVLTGRPGVDISRSGAFGKSATVNIRGLGSGKVLYLVDGRRIAAPASVDGAPSIQHIPTSQIERVEIVRGPRSTLYGSEALGGVVNIITREPDQTRLEASAGYGSYASKQAQASLGGRGGRLGYNLSVSGFDTNGYDVRDDDFDDKDGYENGSVSGRATYAVTDRLGLSVDLLANQGTTEFDNCSDVDASFPAPTFGDCHTDFTQQTITAGADYRLTTRWDTSLNVSHNREESRNFFEDTFNNEFDGTTTTASWQNDVQLSASQLLTLGIEETADAVEQPDDFAEDDRDRTAAFGQWQLAAGNHDLVFGLRGIDDEQFGNHTTGSLDYGVQVAEGLRLLASAGTAFKAPTLFQLYSPQFGSEDLQPEKSASVEVGVAGEAAWGDWDVRAYRTELRDLIEFDFDAGYQNVGEVEVNGLEVGAGAQVGEWNANVSYSWSEPVNEETGAVLANRAERSFRLSMDRLFGAWRTGGSIVAQSDRTGGSFSDPVAGYGILNLHAGYQVARDWRIRGTMENAFDHDYQTNDGFFAAGRTTFVHLEYRPESGA